MPASNWLYKVKCEAHEDPNDPTSPITTPVWAWEIIQLDGPIQGKSLSGQAWSQEAAYNAIEDWKQTHPGLVYQG